MPTENSSAGNDYRALFDQVKRWFIHEANYTRLTAVEKLSVLLSSIAYVAVLIILGGFVVIRLVDTLAVYLADSLGNQWLANIIVVGIVVVLIGIVILMKNTLIVNPITRYISRLFLKSNDD